MGCQDMQCIGVGHAGHRSGVQQWRHSAGERKRQIKSKKQIMNTIQKNELTTKEASKYAELDEIIKGGAKTFMAVGMALVQMHTEKLYRKDFSTFAEYAKSRGISRPHAYRLMEQVGTALKIENVSHGRHDSDTVNIGDVSKLPGKVVSALAQYPEEKRDLILHKAQAKGPVTVKLVNSVAAEMLHIKKPVPVADVAASLQDESDSKNAERFDQRIQDAEKASAEPPVVVLEEHVENRDIGRFTTAPDGKTIVLCSESVDTEILTNVAPETNQADEDRMTASRIEDLEGERDLLAEALKGVQEALGCPSDDYAALVGAIDALKNKTAPAPIVEQNQKPDEMTKKITVKELLEKHEWFKSRIDAQYPAQADREKFGVAANELVKHLMNPLAKKSFNPYGK